MTLAERWIAEGRAQGEALARAAEAEARAAEIKTKTASVLAVLEVRGLSLSPEQRSRIEACADSALLDRWLRAAVTATDVNELF